MADENTRNVVRVDNGKPRANPLRVHRMVGNPDEKRNDRSFSSANIKNIR